jgi:hypothetical protein
MLAFAAAAVAVEPLSDCGAGAASFFGRLRPSRPIAEPRSRIMYFGACASVFGGGWRYCGCTSRIARPMLPSPTIGSARSRVASAVRNAG